jgi:hypothetical protein
LFIFKDIFLYINRGKNDNVARKKRKNVNVNGCIIIRDCLTRTGIPPPILAASRISPKANNGCFVFMEYIITIISY